MILELAHYRVRNLPKWPLVTVSSDKRVWDDEWIAITELFKEWQKVAGEGCGSRFSERNPFNIPGAFYGAATDTCVAGPLEAPHHVMIDTNGQEFLFRQPVLDLEVEQVLRAAWVDPFSGYGIDGDDHWTLSLIREWWSGRAQRSENYSALIELYREQNLDAASVEEWRQFMATEAESYLRQYAFFLEERRIPIDGEKLPKL